MGSPTDSRPIYIADIKTAADESRYNVTQSTLDRYLDIARTKYGVSNEPQFGEFGKKKQTNAVFARIDWQLNATNLLTIRNNFINEDNKRARAITPVSIFTRFGSIANRITTAYSLPTLGIKSETD